MHLVIVTRKYLLLRAIHYSNVLKTVNIKILTKSLLSRLTYKHIIWPSEFSTFNCCAFVKIKQRVQEFIKHSSEKKNQVTITLK